MILQSPKGFNWAMFPLLKGQTQNQVANPQTISISQQSEHKKEAMQFIEYFSNARTWRSSPRATGSSRRTPPPGS